MDPGIVLFLVGQLITGAAIWGAIRADIRNMHRLIESNKEDAKSGIAEAKKTADEAHQRIDRHLEQQMLRRKSDHQE